MAVVTGRRVAWSCMGAGLLSGAVAALMVAQGIRVNVSPSLPVGLYREAPARPGSPARGNMVIACLPAAMAHLAHARRYLGHGDCPGDVRPVGKIVLAVPGDTVTFTASGIIVNRRLVPHSAPRTSDRAGRSLAPYPFGTMVVPPATVVLYAPHDASFDARYLGAVATSSLRAVVRPIWTIH